MRLTEILGRLKLGLDCRRDEEIGTGKEGDEEAVERNDYVVEVRAMRGCGERVSVLVRIQAVIKGDCVDLALVLFRPRALSHFLAGVGRERGGSLGGEIMQRVLACHGEAEAAVQGEQGSGQCPSRRIYTRPSPVCSPCWRSRNGLLGDCAHGDRMKTPHAHHGNRPRTSRTA